MAAARPHWAARPRLVRTPLREPSRGAFWRPMSPLTPEAPPAVHKVIFVAGSAHLDAWAAEHARERPCGISRDLLRAARKFSGLFCHHLGLVPRMRGRNVDQL